jgi:excisionase family DNA binding protein
MPEVSLFSEILSDLAASADTTTPIPKLLFSRKEAAYSLGLSLRSISTLLKNGQLKYRRVGSKVLIPHESLVRFSKSDHALTQ